MKRIGCLFVITVIMITCFAGCGKKENWMPYKLEFGMTYEEAKERFKEIPELEDASSNDGYLTGLYFLEEEEITGYFDFLEPASSPAYAFSFNANKELYEFYCINRFYSVQDYAESLTEDLYNSFVGFYDEKTGTEAKQNEYSDGLKAIWETEKVNVSVVAIEEEDSFYICCIVHNNEYDFID